MFESIVVAVLALIIGLLSGWTVRSHLAALEKLSAALGGDVTGVLTRVEALLGLIHAAAPPAPGPTAAAATPAESHKPTA